MRWLVYRTVNDVREDCVSLHTSKPPEKDLGGAKIKHDRVIEVDDTTDFNTLRLFHTIESLEGNVGH